MPEPPLTACYWNGVTPEPRPVRDISDDGAFIEAHEVWPQGTELNLVLEREGNGGAVQGYLAIWATVVRSGPDGIGVQFIASNSAVRAELRRFLTTVWRGKRAMKAKAGNKEDAASGQALIEFALVLPLLFLLIVNVVNFGGFLYAMISVANAARTGAQYMIMGGATVTAPTPPTAAQIATLVQNDVALLPNGDSLTVRVCTSQFDVDLSTEVQSCTGTGSGVIPADPEPGLYVLASVDVTYTYEPFIPLWEFPALGIRATLPPTTIHRQSVMRMLQ